MNIKRITTRTMLGVVLGSLILSVLSIDIDKIDSINKTPKTIQKPEVKKIQYDLREIIIKDYIIKSQPKVSDKEAILYAKAIVHQSDINKVSPYYQTAISKTESDFNPNAIHGLPYVYGMNGVSAKDWGNFLRDKGIIKKDTDLKNPVTNIIASNAIFKYYMEHYNTPRRAVTGYKGYCAEGARRASKVVEIAVMLKNKEKEYCADYRKVKETSIS